ncbi:MAG: hypothetical protein J6Q19_02210 [Bacteroidaceae bacterium]|nr:hypothetical protein [Bacteroidaceae bacterium]
MKRRIDILTHLLLLLLVLVACTADDAIKENLSHQDEYVTVRMHIPGMKTVATRAAETDNITSIVALVFRNNQLQPVKEYTIANSTLHPISPISGTITIEKPTNGDVIHFLANLPANYNNEKTYIAYLNEQIGKSQTDVLCNLSSRDYDKLSYWGMATRNENNAVMDVMLYRNKAMIEIKPGENCTFRQDELFIAGLDNPNNVGLLVPYNDGFNFDLDNNDYLTLPQNPDPLDKTDELTNYGAGYDNAYYVFEHANPNDAAKGLYVICKIGDDYYKVALHDEKGQPYPIIRNHKYTILVNDLDEGCKTYEEALTAEPIKPTVIETKDVTFTYTDNATVYLNGGASSTLPVEVTIPAGASLTQFSIETYNNFDVTASGGTLTPTDNGYTYAGGSATFTFIPKNAGDYTIQISGSGNNLNDFSRSINVKVDATVMSVVAKNSDSDINMDNSETSATLVLTKPGNVGNVNVSVSSDVFNYSVNGNEYTFTPKNNNIASGLYTVTFCDANYPDKVNCSATITVVNTPLLEYSYTNTTLYMDSNPQLPVTITVPNGSTLTQLNISATGFTIKDANGNTLGTNSYTDNTTRQSGSNVTYTFIPNSTDANTITFSGSGTNIVVPEETISVTVNAAIAATANPSTIYYDGNDKNVTVNVTIPKGVSGLNISAPDFNYGDDTDGSYTYNRGDATTETTVQLEFTLKDGVTEDASITFSDASANANVANATVVINVEATPGVGAETPLWTGEEALGNNNAIKVETLNSDYLNYISVGVTIKAEFKSTDSSSGSKIKFITSWYNDLSQEYQYSGEGTTSYSLLITSDLLNMINNQGGIYILGTNITITKISIVPAP